MADVTKILRVPWFIEAAKEKRRVRIRVLQGQIREIEDEIRQLDTVLDEVNSEQQSFT